MKITDVSVKESTLFFIPIKTRVPLKFGPETTTHVTCARVRLRVENGEGKSAEGWGETPLSVVWAWPGSLPYGERQDRMMDFCRSLNRDWPKFDASGHPVEIGYEYLEKRLPDLLEEHNRGHAEPMPWLAALICSSAFDVAIHDAYGRRLGMPVYGTYNKGFMSRDLSGYLRAAPGAEVIFGGRYPEDYFLKPPAARLKTWHLVGGMDKLTSDELDGSEPEDGYPVLLKDWIVRDGLSCLKIKLRGNDAAWDYERLVKVGLIGLENSVLWLTCDFNCTVTDPEYVNDILDRFLVEYPRLYGMILYVEQPFPYELEENRIDVHSISARKPLFMDESAHDWRKVMLGRELGWTG